ncbi:MAG: cell division protein SepF [Clostridia bacterium]|nr:cell division protein SepF [Clostridia bacterium]
MGIGDKLKKMLNIDDGYFDEVEDDDLEYDPAYSQDNSKRTSDRRGLSLSAPSGTKVVDIHTTAKLQVVLKKPERFEEATGIADELLDKRTVVLNLEATAKDEAARLLCFLSGVAYANGGKLKKIANNTYIITPYNVDVMGDLLDELESNGMFFV